MAATIHAFLPATCHKDFGFLFMSPLINLSRSSGSMIWVIPPAASAFGWRSGWARVDLVWGGLGRAAHASNSVAAAIEAVTRGRDPE